MRVFTAIFPASAALLVGLGVGYFLGHQNGEETGIALGGFDRAINECVHLTLSFRNEKNGEDLAAQDIRYRLLYGAAQDLDSIASGGRLNDEAQKQAFGVVRAVVDYYRENPESISFVERDSILGGSLKISLEELFEGYPE